MEISEEEEGSEETISDEEMEGGYG